MKKVLISLACLIVLAAMYACSNLGNADLSAENRGSGEIKFGRISADSVSADLAAKIDQSHVGKGCEIVELDSGTYIIAYAGERPTAGYRIEITSITAAEGKIIVKVKETSPAEGDITNQVITYPYDAAKLETEVNGIADIEIIK